LVCRLDFNEYYQVQESRQAHIKKRGGDDGLDDLDKNDGDYDDEDDDGDYDDEEEDDQDY
jgi:hypothetical protein